MEVILLSHGAGGREMGELIRRVFLTAYGPAERQEDDSAVLHLPSSRIAFTTDSFVVSPLFFPGGDIGRLAVAGTVNDLLTVGARPLALSASFILEEGLPLETLRRIAASMAATAREAAVSIVTGDTKVVPRGAADQVFITTAGVGEILSPGISGSSLRPGDAVLISGTVGDHGATVMLAREGLLEGVELRSDTAPLTGMVLGLLAAGVAIHAMRDPTRGGVAAALNELARQSQVAIEVEESSIPLSPAVAAACEALGLDPLQVANEGKLLICLPGPEAEAALKIMRASPYGGQAACIGRVLPGPPGRVVLRTQLGTSRLLEPPGGELLPRIC
jgi:hydrogenase expression/formation protein HypE